MSTQLQLEINNFISLTQSQSEQETDIVIKKYLKYLETLKNVNESKIKLRWLFFKEIFLNTTNGPIRILNELLTDSDKLCLIDAEQRFSGKVYLNEEYDINNCPKSKQKIKSLTIISINIYLSFYNVIILLYKLNKKIIKKITIPLKYLLDDQIRKLLINFNNLTLCLIIGIKECEPENEYIILDFAKQNKHINVLIEGDFKSIWDDPLELKRDKMRKFVKNLELSLKQIKN